MKVKKVCRHKTADTQLLVGVYVHGLAVRARQCRKRGYLLLHHRDRKINGIEPFSYLKDVLQCRLDGHNDIRFDVLLHWNWRTRVGLNSLPCKYWTPTGIRLSESGERLESTLNAII